jgi:hypothetical protein
MNLMPHHASAELDVAKLHDYCLNETHPRGRHKARLFARALDISAADSAWLKSQVLLGLSQNEAVPQELDGFGQRWRVDMMLARQGRRAVVRTSWIVRPGNLVPHFVTCWVL